MLETLGASMMGGQVFSPETDYEQRTAFTVGALLLAMSQDWNRAAARLVEENDAMRALFADAAAKLREGTLADRLHEAAGSAERSLIVSELRQSNARLRSLLIELHAHVEALEGETAREVEAAIWRELAASTDRRELALPI